MHTSPANAFNDRCATIHELNARWWRDPATGKRLDRNRLNMLALVHSEISEAVEGERKGISDTHLPARPMAEVELADICIRMWDYCGGCRYDMDTAFARPFPLLRDKSIGGLTAFFAQRFYSRSGDRLEQLCYMHSAVSKIAECEVSGAPSDQTAIAIAWLFALVFDYAGIWGYDLTGAVRDKLAYNAQRKDHTDAARLAAGGKKW